MTLEGKSAELGVAYLATRLGINVHYHLEVTYDMTRYGTSTENFLKCK